MIKQLIVCCCSGPLSTEQDEYNSIMSDPSFNSSTSLFTAEQMEIQREIVKLAQEKTESLEKIKTKVEEKNQMREEREENEHKHEELNRRCVVENAKGDYQKIKYKEAEAETDRQVNRINTTA